MTDTLLETRLKRLILGSRKKIKKYPKMIKNSKLLKRGKYLKDLKRLRNIKTDHKRLLKTSPGLYN